MNATLPLCHDLNCSAGHSQSYRVYNVLVMGLVLPCVATLGIIFNITNAYLFMKPQLMCSMNCFLCALAVSDCLVGSTAIVLFSLLVAECQSPLVSEIHSVVAPFFYPISSVAQTCSVFFTLGAAVDCFISSLLSPVWRKTFCTVRRAVQSIMLIAVFACLYNITKWFELRATVCFASQWNSTVTRMRPTEFRLDDIYYEVYYTYLYTIIMTIGPLMALILLNTFIVLKVCGCLGSKTRSPGGSSGDTVSLIVVVFLFIICNSLALIVNVLEALDTDLGFSLTYVIDLSNLLVVINSSCNFLIYYFFGSAFRLVFNEYCLCCQKSSSLGTHERQDLLVSQDNVDTEIVLSNMKTNAVYDKL